MWREGRPSVVTSRVTVWHTDTGPGTVTHCPPFLVPCSSILIDGLRVVCSSIKERENPGIVQNRIFSKYKPQHHHVHILWNWYVMWEYLHSWIAIKSTKPSTCELQMVFVVTGDPNINNSWEQLSPGPNYLINCYAPLKIWRQLVAAHRAPHRMAVQRIHNFCDTIPFVSFLQKLQIQNCSSVQWH